MSKPVKSKLIRQDQPSSSRVRNSVPLTNEVVLGYLKACQKLSVEHARHAFDAYLKSWVESFDVEIERSRSNQESMDLAGIQRAIKEQASELKRYFCGYFSEGFVKFNKKTLNTGVERDPDQINDTELSLIDNQALEETIAISSITHKADSYFSESLWALNQRFSILNDGETVSEASNPVSPIQLCDSLRRALRLLNIDARMKILAYKIFDLQVNPLVKVIISDCNNYLIENGILPNLKYQLPAQENSADELEERIVNSGTFNDEASKESRKEAASALLNETYESDLVTSIRSLQGRLQRGVDNNGVDNSSPNHAVNSGGDESADTSGDGGANQSKTNASTKRPATVDDLVDVLNSLQKVEMGLTRIPDWETIPEPVNVAAATARIQERLLIEKKSSNVNSNDMQIIDLVGMLFEYMLNDENLPDSVKTLLSYLHTPFLKIAFLDKNFFEQDEHPARLLLNVLAEAGSRYVDHDGNSEFDMFEKIKHVVNQVLDSFENEVKVITELLLSFRAYVKQIQRKQELTEKRAKEKAKGEDKLRQAKLLVNEETRKRIDGKDLPSSMLLFLLQPWTDYLSFILLRYGQMSKSWEEGLLLVDNILWCCEPKKSPGDRDKQQRLYSSVIEQVRSGLDTIGFSKDKTENLVDALSSVIKLAIENNTAEVASEPVREELERKAAEKAGVNASKDDRETPEEKDMVDKLKVIEFGTWLEFEGGRRLKIAWYNTRTTQYMLVNQMGKRVEMMKSLELARCMIARKVKVISGSSKPFFERALENILEKLNERAENLGSEKQDD